MITLWMEGFHVQEGKSSASKLGTYPGETLMEAYLHYIKVTYGENPPSYVRTTEPIIWGCRVFDNEEDSRKQFG